VKRLTLFVKGNVDVRDSLHSCRIGGELLWNGVNDVLRTRFPGALARIRHETWTRSDALLAATGAVPEALAARALDTGAYSLQSQFSNALFTTPADAIVLTLQPDVTNSMLRHRRDGYLLYPNDTQAWTAGDRAWLKAEFEASGPLPVETAMANLTTIIERIRAVRDVPILIYNLSPVIPGDLVHCYMGLGETFATRIRRFNLALIDLSEQTGVSIIDVESLLARRGVDAIKVDVMHTTAEGYALMAEEVVRVLADHGIFEELAA
jgi:lysophospholipase L1-like esterase